MKIVELPPGKPRSLLVAERLEAARGVLADLERGVGEVALAEIENSPGAAKAMAALDGKLHEARAEVDKLEAAHAVALRADRVANAQRDVARRAEQLMVFEKFGAARVAAMNEIFAAIAAAAEAYQRYSVATNVMLTAVPVGTAVPRIHFGNGNYGSSFGDCETLMCREATRLAATKGIAALPFGKPAEGFGDPTRMQPAAEMMTDAQAAILRQVRDQVERLDLEAMTAATDATRNTTEQAA